MNILKAYGVNHQPSINCYDALNDKHASSYFYAKSVKKRLKKLKKVIQLQPHNKQYKTYSELLNQKIAFFSDEENITKNKKQQQQRKELTKATYSQRNVFFNNRNARNYSKSKSPSYRLHKNISTKTVQNFNKSINSRQRSSILARSKSGTQQLNKRSLFKQSQGSINKYTIILLDHNSFISFMAKKRLQILNSPVFNPQILVKQGNQEIQQFIKQQ